MTPRPDLSPRRAWCLSTLTVGQPAAVVADRLAWGGSPKEETGGSQPCRAAAPAAARFQGQSGTPLPPGDRARNGPRARPAALTLAPAADDVCGAPQNPGLRERKKGLVRCSRSCAPVGSKQRERAPLPPARKEKKKINARQAPLQSTRACQLSHNPGPLVSLSLTIFLSPHQQAPRTPLPRSRLFPNGLLRRRPQKRQTGSSLLAATPLSQRGASVRSRPRAPLPKKSLMGTVDETHSCPRTHLPSFPSPRPGAAACSKAEAPMFFCA